MKIAELRDVAAELKLDKTDKLKKQDLVYKILDEQAVKGVKETPKAKPAPRKPSDYYKLLWYTVRSVHNNKQSVLVLERGRGDHCSRPLGPATPLSQLFLYANTLLKFTLMGTLEFYRRCWKGMSSTSHASRMRSSGSEPSSLQS